MGQQSELQALLEGILGSDEVYFQPPANVHMSYPSIVYKRSRPRVRHADNTPYIRVKCYEVTVIDRRPDGVISDKVEALPMCAHDRNFVTDNLHHDIFTLYF